LQQGVGIACFAALLKHLLCQQIVDKSSEAFDRKGGVAKITRAGRHQANHVIGVPPRKSLYIRPSDVLGGNVHSGLGYLQSRIGIIDNRNIIDAHRVFPVLSVG
jgi:hypothetical protein